MIKLLQNKEKMKKQNLRTALKIAVVNNDLGAVAKAAQDIFENGHELEDMEYSPTFFNVVASKIVESGWAPK